MTPTTHIPTLREQKLGQLFIDTPPDASALCESSTDLLTRWSVPACINCGGVRTVYGGSFTSPEVLAEMAAIENTFVDLNQLNDAAGHALAQMTGTEAGLVTAGSAAALTICTAIAIAGDDPIAMMSLPEVAHNKRDVVMPRSHISAYDVAIRGAGGNIVPIDTLSSKASDQSKAVLGVFVGLKEEDGQDLSFDTFKDRCAVMGIPTLVDAASEFLDLPEYWTRRGADLVTYSGGKRLGGPNGAAILLGKKQFLDKARYYNSPAFGIARNMKATKDEIVGMVRAVDIAHRVGSPLTGIERQSFWLECLDHIANRVGFLEGVSCHVAIQSSRQPVPRLKITWHNRQQPLTGWDVREYLRSLQKPIILEELWITENSVTLDPFCMVDDDQFLVAKELVSVLSQTRGSHRFNTVKRVAKAQSTWLIDVPVSPTPWKFSLSVEQNEAAKLDWVSDGPAVTTQSELILADGRQLIFKLYFETPTCSLCMLFEGEGEGALVEGTASVGQVHGDTYCPSDSMPTFSWQGRRLS